METIRVGGDEKHEYESDDVRGNREELSIGVGVSQSLDDRREESADGTTVWREKEREESERAREVSHSSIVHDEAKSLYSQSEVHGRVRNGDNPGPPVEKSVSYVFPNDSIVRLERVLRVEASTGDGALFFSEEARGVGTRRKEEEYNDGEEQRGKTFDEEEDLVLRNFRIDVLNTVGNKTREAIARR